MEDMLFRLNLLYTVLLRNRGIDTAFRKEWAMSNPPRRRKRISVADFPVIVYRSVWAGDGIPALFCRIDIYTNPVFRRFVRVYGAQVVYQKGSN
ncbi:hypothetical protein JXQ31_04960 [candidate division KSB1 bacterium]|nr:hypothetical protein [candidate division KSB1 bacterium]